MERHLCRLHGLRGPLQAIHDGEHAEDIKTRLAKGANGAKRGAARGGRVFEDDNFALRRKGVAALN